MTIQEAIALLHKDLQGRVGEEQYIPDIIEAERVAIRSLEAWDDVKKQIASVKHNLKSENIDYLTGYICALSSVEGMTAIAEKGSKKYWDIVLKDEAVATGEWSDSNGGKMYRERR